MSSARWSTGAPASRAKRTRCSGRLAIRAIGMLLRMPGAENISRRWKRSGPVGWPFASSISCIAIISTAFFRASGSRTCPRTFSPISICAWHRLDAWPDSAPGLARLRTKFLVAPVSNGNISLMVDLARRNGFPWDAILGAEIAGDFKPKPRVYLAACEAFDLAPAECMMVAAHSSDLSAAAACGLRTGHIARPERKRRRASARKRRPCRSISRGRTWRISPERSERDEARYFLKNPPRIASTRDVAV